MARDGINPSRSRTTDYHPARVTVAVLTHLPHQTGYFESRLDVTRMTIESILANTGMPFDLWVFDNGSCAPVVDYLRGLRDEGRITQLILSSKNIGKPAALQTIFKACQSEIIAYTDDDVFFLPGWLEEHIRIIDTYPNVGAVTGFYIRERMKNGIDSTLAFLDQPGVSTERGLLMPAIWEEEYRVNSGRSLERYNAEVAGLEDIRVTYHDVQAWVSAHHFQFVAPREVILQALPQEWTGLLMGKMVEMDLTIDRLGYLRLCTGRQTVRLMGNLLDPEVLALAEQSGIELQSRSVKSSRPASGLLNALYRLPFGKRVIHGLYNQLYKVVNS